MNGTKPVAVSPSTAQFEQNNDRRPKGPLLRWARIADVVLVGGGLASLTVAFYFVYYYSWTRQRQFSSSTAIALYNIVPVVIAGLFFLSLRLKPTHKINLAILSCSLAISLYATEAFLSLLRPHSLPSSALWGAHIESHRDEVIKLAKSFGATIDDRSTLDVVVDLRRKGIDAVPIVPVHELLEKQADKTLKSIVKVDGAEVLPLGGVSNKTTVFCNEGGGHTIYQSAEHGFNNPRGLWALGEVDIIAVGDSFALGGCVPPQHSFIDLVRERYPATINISMAGHGPLSKLATLKESLLLLRPKMVLWFHFEQTDPDQLKLESKSPLLLRYLENGFTQKLLSRQPEIDNALIEHIQNELNEELSRRENSKKSLGAADLINVLKLPAWRTKIGLPGQSTDEDAAVLRFPKPEMFLFRSILMQAKSLVTDLGGELYFVYLPAWERYGNAKLARKDRNHVLELTKSLNIRTIDVHHAFQAQDDPLSLFPFRRFGHYNKEGHRLAAETVLQSIRSDNQSAPAGSPAADKAKLANTGR
jgi:hypothetical protein